MKTNRLIIRKFHNDDGDSLYEYLSDEKVVHYEPYAPMSLEQCRAAALKMSASQNFWAACLPSGVLIGQVYLAEQAQKTWEVGYVFKRKYHGKGYASEAVCAVVTDVFKHYNAHRITANCNPDNVRSWKLLERLGLRREGHLISNIYFKQDDAGNPVWQDTYIYSVLKCEWNYGV